MNFSYKSKNNKKAFTLIELLIVIAIIGILFIVLVSRVDFATDKAKATGVQTDFRSFQLAFEQVAKENAGFNTFGWDTGDTNGDRIRNSYDRGDTNQNGKEDPGETFTGRKTYGETWTGIYTLIKPGTTTYAAEAIGALEASINSNLDPKLHITIGTDGVITMANGATDPWKNAYHGRYLSNAARDNCDLGVLIMYSDGPNGKNGSADGIAEGLVNITTPGNNVYGKDDYAIATFYTKANGYGEVQSVTSGFSNNQIFNDASSVPVTLVNDAPEIVVPTTNDTPQLPAENPTAENLDVYSWSELKTLANAKLSKEDYENKYGIKPGAIKTVDGVKYMLVDLGLDEGDYDGFVFMYVLNESHQMHFESTFVGGYFAMDLRNYVDNIYYTMSDSYANGLKENIKQVTIQANTGSKDAAGNYLSCKTLASAQAYVFLASFTEVGYIQTSSPANQQATEGICFDYFAEDDQAARYSFAKIFNNNKVFSWWLRSATTSTNGFFHVQGAGVFVKSSSLTTEKMVAVFVIG